MRMRLKFGRVQIKARCHDFRVSIQSTSHQGRLNRGWGKRLCPVYLPNLLRRAVPAPSCLLLSPQGGVSNNQNFPMENCAVGRFTAVPQGFQHLTALQRKFERSLSDLSQRGIIGTIIGIIIRIIIRMIIGILGVFCKPPA